MNKKQNADAFFRRQREQMQQHQLGSHGAASGVRHIDPAIYQVGQNSPDTGLKQSTEELRPPLAQKKTAALLDAADRILIADAKRRHGKRIGKRVKNLIITGRYR